VWSRIGSSAVVIEADAVKNQDVVLKVLCTACCALQPELASACCMQGTLALKHVHACHESMDLNGHGIAFGACSGQRPATVLQELRSSGLFNQEDAKLSQFVHDYSTRRAQGALVAAVNEQRDIIFDGALHLQ
jgi:hypothetical protein